MAPIVCLRSTLYMIIVTSTFCNLVAYPTCVCRVARSQIRGRQGRNQVTVMVLTFGESAKKIGEHQVNVGDGEDELGQKFWQHKQ